jgi:hypothetical protein
LKDTDSRFEDIINIINKLDWNLDKKNRFYYRLSLIKDPVLKDMYILKPNQYINNFEV